MSTGDQCHSIANQRAAISIYAAKHGLAVVRTYEDAGKSGLTASGRPGLKRLIEDIQTGSNDFSVVLVYDISRWGRFQDADESAYYEFLCKKSGVSVIYCAEQFGSVQTIAGTIAKGIKRAMAGEFSRELSARTFASQMRLAKIGNKLGRQAVYGYRRVLIGSNGRTKRVLERGEHKAIKTDSVTLLPGPPDEIRTVRWIFRIYATGNIGAKAIADRLTKRGVSPPGKRWGLSTIQRILANETYIGTLVWNRTSEKLKTRQARNPPEQWIRVEGAHQPIIGHELFGVVQKVLRKRGLPRFSSEVLLQKLSQALGRHGRLTQKIINADPRLPHAHSYWKRFGSIRRAYELIGYRPSHARQAPLVRDTA